MDGRTPQEALRSYLEPLRTAIHCISDHRLTLIEREELKLDKAYTIALNSMDPIALQGEVRLSLRLGQTVRIVRTDLGDPRGPLRVSLIKYFYEVATPDRRAILSFHWTPEDIGEGIATFPHLHIGPALLTNQTVVRPKDLHKAHIPTGHISLEAVIHLLIADFHVTPRNPRWREILQWSSGPALG